MKSVKILVADDSQCVRVHLHHLLTQEGFEVAMAGDGATAVELLRDSCPDLAVLDITMPRLDGYGVCEAIRDSGMNIPIIFLTSIQSNAVKMLGHEMGAYLNKPVAGDELLRTIRQILAATTAN